MSPGRHLFPQTFKVSTDDTIFFSTISLQKRLKTDIGGQGFCDNRTKHVVRVEGVKNWLNLRDVI
jgi:hypothetical protein